MINTRIEIDGEMKDVELFDDMYDYVSEHGTDISDYTICPDSDEEFIVEEVDFVQDTRLFTFDMYEINGVDYVHVKWGEKQTSLIKFDGLNQTLYIIYQTGEDGEYNNYRSWIFQTEEEAQDEVDKLNAGAHK